MKSLKKGFLISIEGIDGAGKSVLIKNLYKKLQKEYTNIITTYEPGATQIGNELRNIVLNKDYPISEKAEFLLFATDRAEHFSKIIIPKLAENFLIISDRLSDSSLAFQGYGKNIDLNSIKSINKFAMQNIKINLSFYLKIDATTALERIKNNRKNLNIFESKIINLNKKIIAGFDAIFSNKKNSITLDAQNSPEKLLFLAYNKIKTALKKYEIK